MSLLQQGKYNGIKFIDIDGDWSFTDFDCDRIPNKGDVLQFRHLIGNDSFYKHFEVLYIFDQRLTYGNANVFDCEVKSQSISVICRLINPKLGNSTYRSIYQLIDEQGYRNYVINKLIEDEK